MAQCFAIINLVKTQFRMYFKDSLVEFAGGLHISFSWGTTHGIASEFLLANRASSPLRVGIPKQCHALFPKIREANVLPSSELNKRIFEVHPELCFYEINDGKALRHGKKAKNGVGIEERCRVLRRTIFRDFLSEILALRPRGVSKDDAVDAIAACWSAIRIQAIPRQSIPTNDKPPTIWR